MYQLEKKINSMFFLNSVARQILASGCVLSSSEASPWLCKGRQSKPLALQGKTKEPYGCKAKGSFVLWNRRARGGFPCCVSKASPWVPAKQALGFVRNETKGCLFPTHKQNLKKKNYGTFLGATQDIRSQISHKYFWNQTFDKGRLKNFVLWFFLKYGEHKTVQLVEELKTIGFQYATKAGISLGIEDLKIPEKKSLLILEAENLSMSTIKQFKRGEITEVERFQRLIDTWHRTSERLKIEVIENFEETDVLNPVYMMAFSGARGNISQVRQLVGMRGLMSNPQGQIIDFPIRSNFREGLTLTEYIISSYGARKGIVDTALRTANAGYLTRRLVDVAQHVIISSTDCGTTRGIFLTDMKEGNKIIYSLQNRLIGRVLARDLYKNDSHPQIKIADKNLEISGELATIIAQNHKKVFVRSPLTCQTNKLVCQLCYGWSLAQGNLVSIGEAVGVVAAQSIGEPGTQLTMRTFHTGGVFSGNVSDQIKAPFDGIVVYKNPIAGKLIRTPEGKIAFLTKTEGTFSVYDSESILSRIPKEKGFAINLRDSQKPSGINQKNFKIPFYTLLFLRNCEKVVNKQVIAQISSINRQKTATDQAEITIKAEISGLFYSKNLEIEENKVGPVLAESMLSLPVDKTKHGLRLPKEPRGLVSLENKDDLDDQESSNPVLDTINRAWNWGYAWILSGKIYQLPLPSSFFPIFGDFVNQKTYMNSIKWNMPGTFGSGLKLNIPFLKGAPLNSNFFNQNRVASIYNIETSSFSLGFAASSCSSFFFLASKGSSKQNKGLSSFGTKGLLRQRSKPLALQGKKWAKGKTSQTQALEDRAQPRLLPKYIKKMRRVPKPRQLPPLSEMLTKKDLKWGCFSSVAEPKHPILKMHLISFDSTKILYKNIGYFFKLSEPSSSFSVTNQGFLQKTKQPVAFDGSHAPDCSSAKDSILSLNDTLFLFSSIFSKKNLIAEPPNPSSWKPSFNLFLNWFPKRFLTKTGGLIFIEPSSFFQSTKISKVKAESLLALQPTKVFFLASEGSSKQNKIISKKMNSFTFLLKNSKISVAEPTPILQPVSLFLKQRWFQSRRKTTPSIVDGFKAKGSFGRQNISATLLSFPTFLKKDSIVPSKPVTTSVLATSYSHLLSSSSSFIEKNASSFPLEATHFYFSEKLHKKIKEWLPLIGNIKTGTFHNPSAKKIDKFLGGALAKRSRQHTTKEGFVLPTKLAPSTYDRKGSHKGKQTEGYNLPKQSQTLIYEQYSQNLLGISLLSNKILPNQKKLPVGFPWKNSLKFNWGIKTNLTKENSSKGRKNRGALVFGTNSPSIVANPKEETSSSLSFARACFAGRQKQKENKEESIKTEKEIHVAGNKKLLTLERIFWVPQSFFQIREKSKKPIFLNLPQPFIEGGPVSLNKKERIFLALQQKQTLKPKLSETLLQINRQGKIKSYNLGEQNEGYLQITSCFSPHLLNSGYFASSAAEGNSVALNTFWLIPLFYRKNIRLQTLYYIFNQKPKFFLRKGTALQRGKGDSEEGTQREARALLNSKKLIANLVHQLFNLDSNQNKDSGDFTFPLSTVASFGANEERTSLPKESWVLAKPTRTKQGRDPLDFTSFSKRKLHYSIKQYMGLPKQFNGRLLPKVSNQIKNREADLLRYPCTRACFAGNSPIDSILLKKLKKRKKIIGGALPSYNIGRTSLCSFFPTGRKNNYNSPKEFLNLKTFSKITSVPYLLECKAHPLNRAALTLPLAMRPVAFKLGRASLGRKRLLRIPEGSSKQNKGDSEEETLFQKQKTFLASRLNKNLRNLLVNQTENIQNFNSKVKTKLPHLFNFYFYSLFKSEVFASVALKKKQINSLPSFSCFQRKTAKAREETPLCSRRKQNSIMDSFLYTKKYSSKNNVVRLCLQSSSATGLSTMVQNQGMAFSKTNTKLNNICSPYLKNEFSIYPKRLNQKLQLNKKFDLFFLLTNHYKLNFFYNKGLYYYTLTENLNFSTQKILNRKPQNFSKEVALLPSRLQSQGKRLRFFPYGCRAKTKHNEGFCLSNSSNFFDSANFNELTQRTIAHCPSTMEGLFSRPSKSSASVFDRFHNLKNWFKVANFVKRTYMKTNFKSGALASAVESRTSPSERREQKTLFDNFSNPNLNILLKQGWFYYTKNVSKFFLSNKKLIQIGKTVASSFVFDKHSIYIEIIPMREALAPSSFPWLQSKTRHPLNANDSLYQSKGINKKRCHSEVSLSSKISVQQNSFNFFKTIKNKNCRCFIPSAISSKTYSIPLQGLASSSQRESEASQREKRKSKPFFLRKNKAKERGEFLILIRKANEFKFFSELEVKKEIYQLATQKNGGPVLYQLNKSRSIFLSYSTKIRARFENQIFQTKKTPFQKIALLRSFFPPGNKANSGLLRQRSKPSGLLRWTNQALPVTKPSTIFPLACFAGQSQGFFPNTDQDIRSFFKITSIKMQSKFLNKKYNSIGLYSYYKTGLLNKQKITLQAISKYQSSHIKLISKGGSATLFYPFLSNLQKEIKHYLGESLRWTPSSLWKNPTGYDAYEVFPLAHFVDEAAKPKNEKKMHRIGYSSLSVFPITSLKSLNLSPFILSYKAPYALDFPFKNPTCFFSEQYQPTFAPLAKQSRQPSMMLQTQGEQTKGTALFNIPWKSKLTQNSSTGRALSSKGNQQSNKYSQSYYLKKLLSHYLCFQNEVLPSEKKASVSLKIRKATSLSSDSPVPSKFTKHNFLTFQTSLLTTFELGNTLTNFSCFFFSPIVEYSLVKDFPNSIAPCLKSEAPAPRYNIGTSSQKQKACSSFPSKAKGSFGKQSEEKRVLGPAKQALGSVPLAWQERISLSFAKKQNNEVPHNKKFLYGMKTTLLGSLTQNGHREVTLYSNRRSALQPQKKIQNKEDIFYKTDFLSFMNNTVNSQLPLIKTYAYSSFEGELVYRKKNFKKNSYSSYSSLSEKIYSDLLLLKKTKPQHFLEDESLRCVPSSLWKNPTDSDASPLQGLASLAEPTQRACLAEERVEPSDEGQVQPETGTPLLKQSIQKIIQQNFTDYFLANKIVDHVDNSCMILTKKDQISYAFPVVFSSKEESQNYKENYLFLEKFKKTNQYSINNIVINVLNLIEDSLEPTISVPSLDSEIGKEETSFQKQKSNNSALNFSQIVELNKLPAGLSQQKSKVLIGEFLVYGDKIAPNLAISKGGQIIHINNKKITLRQGQPIFVSPQAILHKYDGDFIDEQSSVITLAYQQLKTGDIVQGIPKIEQFFEARTTKRGRLFKDSLENLLKAIFNRYNSKLSREQAVRQSFYKIQQIIIDGVQRVYRSQGVTIADKHLEVIVKQMTSKVRITFGGSTGYLPGEICDLYDIELLNKELRPKIMYEPIVLGITKASLEVKSFLSAASFQQTTRVLSRAALSRKNDYLNGLKENVILGNLIPAGTGYLVYLDQSLSNLSKIERLKSEPSF